MKRVLVTGANGFVGNHLLRELSANGIETIAIAGKHGTRIKSADIDEHITLDLNNPKSVDQINFNDVDAIIHLAGLAAVGPSFDNPMEYIKVNMGIEVNLFETALAQNAKPKFLIVSSGSIYDPRASLPLTETSSLLPNSPYAVSKMGQEQMARYYQERGFECIIARPFNHIGPGQNLGFIVPDLAKQVIDFEKGLAKEVLVGNLDAKRDYTDVRDITRAYRLLLEKGVPGETYNICSGTSLSGRQILSSITKAADCKPNIVEDKAKMRPSDAPIIYGSYQKLTIDTGWKPKITLDETIRDVVADWRQRD
jgi:GDP-4-dehydro-6-deoxy-D-mannose reductase